MLSDSETEEIKEQIISHIETTFPEEQISNAKQQVEAMNSEQLEKFLEKNKIMKGGNLSNSKNECIFCSIAADKIKSVKIDENDNTMAVLEINPISRGHVLVIPKEHAEKSSKEAMNLAKKISKKIQKKLKPRKIEISESRLFGHEVINVLPIYNRENFDSERNSAKIEELEEIKEELEKEKEKPIRKAKTEKIKVPWLPKRIP